MLLKIVRFLAVLVALIVPVQGMAAIAAGQCMALGHHEVPGQDSHVHAPDNADGSGHATHAHPDDASQGEQADANTAHCGPCAACCGAVSITGQAGVSIASSPSNAEHVFSQVPPVGLQPDGVYRPPLPL